MPDGLPEFLLIVGAILAAGCIGVLVCAFVTAARSDECGWPIQSDQGIVPCPMHRPCPVHDTEREAQ